MKTNFQIFQIWGYILLILETNAMSILISMP